MSNPGRRYRPWMGISVITALVVMPLQGYAEIYSYVDSRGKKVFVDSPSKIPAQYRKKSQQRQFSSQPRLNTITPQNSETADTIEQRFKLEAQLRKLNKTLARMETPVTVRGNQVLVPVKVDWRGNKKTLRLLLDTGASITVLHRQSVSSLNPAGREKSYARVAGGGTIKTERVVFDRLSVGPYDIDDKNTAVIEHQGGAGFDGLLGMDVLGNLRYNIDFQNNKIVWSPEKYDDLLDAQAQLKETLAGLKAADAEAEKSPQ
ncbi:MAG: aspartyl protease family protein [Amphritea sp.]|nr:aspartyl protease family protein [Amphritea sp.]